MVGDQGWRRLMYAKTARQWTCWFALLATQHVTGRCASLKPAETPSLQAAYILIRSCHAPEWHLKAITPEVNTVLAALP